MLLGTAGYEAVLYYLTKGTKARESSSKVS